MATDPTHTIVTVPVVFKIDNAEWAEEYGISVPEAQADIIKVLTSAIGPGIPELLGNEWATVRGHVTAGPPITDGLSFAEAAQAVLLAFGGNAPTEDLTQVDESELYVRLHALEAEIARRNENLLLAGVREALAKLYADDDDPVVPVEVRFGTWEWEDGWFYNASSATVIFADGTKETDVDFGDRGSIGDQLRELADVNGVRLGKTAGFKINVMTGETDSDGYMFV